MTGATPYRPRCCVWEITLACNANCIHCGSNAGVKRASELCTQDALNVVGELATLGCESVTLSGGEPLIRQDWPEIAAAVRHEGMRLEMITNGLLAAAQADRIAAADFFAVTFSVDGPHAIHDRQRGVNGALNALLLGAKALRDRGVRIGAVTQLNRLNVHTLDALHDLLDENGFSGWQLQLTMPHGKAKAHRDTLCLAPDDLPAVENTLLSIRKRTTRFVQAADNFGYMGRGEPALRGGKAGTAAIFQGCSAGCTVVGITSDGKVRGCLSLPSVFDEGDLRTASLSEIWHGKEAFHYNRQFSVADLTGACAACPFNRICKAGCRSLAYATTGFISDNPYCLRRVKEGWSLC